MSRIGKKPISIPEGVKIAAHNGLVKVEGPKGALEHQLYKSIKIEMKDKTIFVLPEEKNRSNFRFWGLERALLSNMIQGVTLGFEKVLEIEGIGFKAEVQGTDLVLSLGFSHPLTVKAPEGIIFKVVKNAIYVSGINKELVGETAAKIRSLKKPEPYKGKGIRYKGEVVRRKAGKKAVAAGS